MVANIKYEIAYIIFPGLNPNPELHTTYLNIEPMTGNKYIKTRTNVVHKKVIQNC